MGYSVTKAKIQKIFTKLIKLTYVQSLTVDNNVARVNDYAIETSEQEDKNRGIDASKLVQKGLSATEGAWLGSIFGGAVGAIAGAFGFGKRVRTWTTADIKTSGWTISKIWNQPQFDVLRYAIGIRDVEIAQFRYNNVSELISVPWVSPKEISKVILNVDQFIPNKFPTGRFVKYYIKPNIQDFDFVEINPIGQPTAFNPDGSIIPRIINFNVEKPIGSSLEDRYIFTSIPVKEIIFKAIFTRPDSLTDGETAEGYSPILKSYRLLLYPKNSSGGGSGGTTTRSGRSADQSSIGEGGSPGDDPASASLWSDPSTWGGAVPGPGEDVVIPMGSEIILDVDTDDLSSLTIEGTLRVLQGADVSITSDMIMVMDGGILIAGTEEEPFTGLFTITLTGTTPTSYTVDPEDNSKLYNGRQKALMVMPGGMCILHGVGPLVNRTRIGAHIDVSVEDNQITLSEPVTWKAGDKIVLSKTDFYAIGETEMLTVASDVNNSTIVPVVENIGYDRWGVMQYATDSGMSLTPGTLTRNDSNTPTTLDERATVMHMTRNIVIQGADDISWSTDAFGGHTMVMGLNSVWQVQNVEFKRMGQQHFKGRYPVHFHMLSFTPYGSAGSGTYLGDVPSGNIYTKKCSVWNSSQRAIVIHGTCGVTVENCNVFDIKSHAIFEEDGSEERNTITECCVMKVRAAPSGKRVKINDVDASGFWLTNPNNTVTHNFASDCVGRGFWNSFADTPFGLSRDVSVVPRQTVVLFFDDNEGHSNYLQAFRTNGGMTDEAGNTGEIRYLDNFVPTVTEFFMRRNIGWKNTTFGYENRVGKGRYLNWTMADNDGASDFFGSSLFIAKNRGPLLIHTSLNNANTATFTAKNAVASYHFEMDFENIVAIGYALQPAYYGGGGGFVYGGGVFGTGDLYTSGSFYQLGRSFGWTLINSHAGRLPKSPLFDGFAMAVTASSYRYWTLGFLHDPYGYWDATNPGRWIVMNRTLYTYGLSTTTVIDTDWVSTPDPVYGVNRIQFDDYIGWGNSRGDANVVWHRLDNSNAIIDSHEVGLPSEAHFFPNMGSFMANKDGRFLLEFKTTGGVAYDLTTIDEISIGVEFAHLTSDTFLIGVPWDGGRVPTRVSIDSAGPDISTIGRSINLTGTSIADVLADTSGATAWQDTVNDIIWVRWVGLTAGTFVRTDPVTTEYNSTIGTYTQFLRIVV